jgi:hypothetical protein
MKWSLSLVKFALSISSNLSPVVIHWHSDVVFHFLFLTETSIFSVEGVFLYPEGRPCAVKTWKFPISIGCLLQLCRNEVLQLSDDWHQTLCLIGSVYCKGYPLMLLENSSSGTIITILPPGLGGVIAGKSCVYFDWRLPPPLMKQTCSCSHWNFLSWHDSDVLVESFIYLRKRRVVECGGGKPK